MTDEIDMSAEAVERLLASYGNRTERTLYGLSELEACIRALLARAEAAEAEVRKDRIERDAMIEQIRNSEIVYDEMKAKLARAREWADALLDACNQSHRDGGAEMRALIQYRPACLDADAPAPVTVASGGVAAIAAERQRQMGVEGWTPEHHDQHEAGELSQAAASYAWAATMDTVDRGDGSPTIWPWDRRWWKPKDRRRDLVKAGALIAAEIDRLDRALSGGEEG